MEWLRREDGRSLNESGAGGGAGGGAGDGPLQDLRQLLREKAEGHSRFYRQLSQAALATGTGPPHSMAPETAEDYAEEICRCHAKSTMILEAQYEDLPTPPVNEDEIIDSFPADRRLSTLSNCDGEIPKARRVRTPSVVVSDYCDEVNAGIGTEEIEYLRKKAEAAASPSSGRSSCESLDSNSNSRRGSNSSLECDRLSCPEPEYRPNFEASPSASDFEDGDSGLGPLPAPRKMDG